MIEGPVIYTLIVISIILQMIIVILLAARLKPIEKLIKKESIETKQQKYQTRDELSIVENFTTTQPPEIKKDQKSTKNNQISVKGIKDNQDILFIKQIKLDKRSQVIDMNVQLNNKKR